MSDHSAGADSDEHPADSPDRISGTGPGRTTSRLDDVLTRTVGRVAPTTALCIAFAVYIVVGIVLPLALNFGRVGLVSWSFMAGMWAFIVALAAIVTAQQAMHRRLLLEWTSDLRKLDATEFEWLVGELLRREGWNVQETGRPDGPDGNIDLRAECGGRSLVIQCKRWTANVVGVDEVRKLAGTVSGEKSHVTTGVLVTLSRFSDAAIEEASRLRIELVDNVALLTRIDRVRASEPCPNCGASMRLDRSSRGRWLRCPRYPHCSGKRDLTDRLGTAVDLLLARS